MAREYVSRTWRYIGLASGVLWLVLFFTAAALWLHYDRTRPPVADPTIGRVYPLNTHGSIVYLAHAERLELYGLIALAIIVGAAMIVIEVVKGPFRMRR